MSSIVPVLMMLTASAASGPAAIKATSHIDRVTVFRHQALVIRNATANVASGDLYKILVEGLPSRLDAGTVQARCRGAARPVVTGVTVANAYSPEATNAEAKEIEQKLRQLAQQDQALRDELGGLKERRRFLLALRDAYVKRVASEDVKLDLAQWAKVQQTVSSGIANLATQRRNLQEERRKLAKKKDAVRKLARDLASKRQTRTRVAQIDVKARRAGRVSCEVRYLVSNVSWSSSYDARQDDGMLFLSHFAQVSNRSGEDWHNVELSLSTADPIRAVRVPSLYPMVVSFWRRYARTRGGWKGKYAPVERSLQQNLPMGGARDETKKEDREAWVAEDAIFNRRSLHAVYTARTRATVASTGAPRKVMVASHRFLPDLRYIAAPRVAQGAFLTAKAKNTSKKPILAGEVRLFLGDDFIGRTRVGTVVPGDELVFSFGRDERVRVERRRLLRNNKVIGFWSKENELHERYEIKVRNLTGKKIRIAVLDQLPVSQTDKIKVVVDEDSTARTKPQPKDRPGTLRWNLDLNDGGSHKITFGYRVRYPLNQRIRGV